MDTKAQTQPAAELALPGRLALLLVGPLTGLSQAGLTPVLPKISAHFASYPDAEALVRMLLTSVTAAMILGSVGIGFLAARFTQRQLMLWALALFAFGGTIGYVLDNLYMLIGSRALLGVAAAAAGTLAPAIYSTQLAASSRDKWLGLYVVAGTFGSTILIPLCGVIGGYDWRLVFLVHLISLPVLALVAIFVPAPPARPASATTSKTASGGGLPVGISLVGLATGGVVLSVGVFLPFQMKANGLADPKNVAIALMCLSLVSAITSSTFGWLSARLTVLKIFMFGFAVNAVATAILVFVPGVAGPFLGMAVQGIAMGTLVPNLYAAAANVAPPEGRTRSLGFARGSWGLAPLLAQAPLEPLTRAYGPSAALLAIAIASAALVVIFPLGRGALKPAAAAAA